MNTVEKRNSKRIVVLVKKIKTIDILNEKLEMVEAGFQNLKDERKPIIESLDTDIKGEPRYELVKDDKAKTKEQKRLQSLRVQLLEHKKVILELQEAEINDYVPEDLEW